MDDLHRYYIENTFKKVLKLCPNLQSLCITDVSFTNRDADMLMYATSSLKVLKLIRCSEIEDDWSGALKHLTNLTHLTLTGGNETTADFFEYTNNLISLAIDYNSCSEIDALQMIFDKIGLNIKQLKLLNFYPLRNDYQSIVNLIIDKLPKLEHLAIEDDLINELTSTLTKLPYLKSLKVYCYSESVNALLRQLSNIGTIEDLNIEMGFYNKEKRDAPPLVFNKLSSFRLSAGYTSLEFLNALTKSIMPAILNFDLDFEENSVNGMFPDNNGF